MTRKRLWELGATAALMVAAGAVAAGFWRWEQQQRLDRELAAALSTGYPADADHILSLLHRGASVNVRGSTGNTVLLEAVLEGSHVSRLPLFREALARGADVNAADDGGFTPLMAACAYGRPERAELLLSHGADVNRRCKNGYTALWYAKEGSRSQEVRQTLIRLLKQNGAKE
jgi:ankyrin repeat protein